MTEAERKKMLERVRAKMAAKKGGRARDPNQWRPPQVKEGDIFKAKGFFMPPLKKGDRCATGICEHDMEELFYLQVGMHWIDRKPYPCPRVFDGDECDYCTLGFKLLQETGDKELRKQIGREYLPRTLYAVNVYFPKLKENPEELRGRVVYYEAPKTVFDKMDECITREDDGGDPDDPQAWGFFYMADGAYPFLWKINHKAGYNNYADSKFIPKLQPIAKSAKGIEEILSMRHDLVSKYPARTKETHNKLSNLARSVLSDDSVQKSSETKNDGFDEDETSINSSEEAETKKEEEQSSLGVEDESKLNELLAKIDSGEI